MNRVVTFRVDGAGYALPADAVHEVVELEGLESLPFRGNAEVVGLTRFRGRYIPVIDLPGITDEETGPGRRSPGSRSVLLVLGRGTGRLGLRVNELGEVRPLEMRTRGGREVPVVEMNGELVRYLEPGSLVGGDDSVLLGGGDPTMEASGAPEEKLRVVTVRLGPEVFGIDVMKVFEVLRVPDVRNVPKAPDFVEGVTEARGEVVPIIDLRKRFSLPETAVGPETRLLIVAMGENRIGLLVDGVPGVAEYPADAVNAPPEIFRGLESRYLDGIVKEDERLLLLLNIEEVLSSEERIALETMLDDAGGGERPGPDGHSGERGDRSPKKKRKKRGGKNREKERGD